MKIAVYIFVIFIGSYLIGCGDKKSVDHSEPSGLTVEQQIRYKNLPSEGKALVDQQMRAFDQREKTQRSEQSISSKLDTSLKEANALPPDGKVFKYVENSGKLEGTNASEELFSLLDSTAKKFQVATPIFKNKKDEWESDIDYKKRVTKFSLDVIKLSSPLDKNLKDTLLAIRLDSFNGFTPICADMVYDLEKKTLSVQVHTCGFKGALFVPELLDEDVRVLNFPLVACCVGRKLKFAIQNTHPLMGRGLSLKPEPGLSSRTQGALVSVTIPMTVDKARSILPSRNYDGVLLTTGFDLVFVGKVSEKTIGPIPPDSIPFDLKKILLVNASSGEIIFDRSVK